MIRKFFVGGAAATATLLALTGCTITVGETQVEDAIRTNLGPQLSVPIDEVSCPQDLKGEVGQKMTCTINAGGQQRQIEVTVTSVDGSKVNFDMKEVS